MKDHAARLQAALSDRYQVERELGRGGMAAVYLARDLRHDRLVALKVLHPEHAASLGPERFQREIRLAARLQALNRLEPLLKQPYYLSPGWLRIDPTFDPIRKHPRFRRLVEGMP